MAFTVKIIVSIWNAIRIGLSFNFPKNFYLFVLLVDLNSRANALSRKNEQEMDDSVLYI